MSINTDNDKRPQHYRQNGSALMLALFIIIILMLLGTALVDVLSTSSEGVAQEVLGTRALSAANSGVEAQLQVIFPLNNAPSVCEANTVNNSYNFTNVNGLTHCTAIANCELYSTHDSINYYRVTSTGTCGSSALESNSLDVVVSRRTIQVEARSL